MAFFSRKKSKAKKATKEEEKKAAAAAKAATAPIKAPQRGRNGKIIVTESTATENAMHDIPAPSQLPRHFHSPLGQDRGRTYSFEDPNHSGNDKHEYSDPHSSSDSGYASPGPESRVQSRGQSTQQSRQDREYLPVSNKSMPQLTLGEELAQEPVFAEHSPPLKPSKSLHTMREESNSDHLGPLPTTQYHQYHHQDGKQQRMIQQSMPMRPSSVPAQALQPRHQRVNRPPPQRSSSPGPVLQSTHPAHSPRSRASVPSNPNSPFDWQSPVTRSHHQQSSSFEPRSPTSPKAHIANSSFDQDDYSPSLNILNGLKVNRRGLILDEEGDPIGELFEGDILDCVRQKADAYGDVLDEYGRIVGRVRTLSVRPTSSSLHRSNTNASNAEYLRDAPPVPATRSAVPSSPTRMPSASRRHNTSEDEGYLVMRLHDPQDSGMPQRQVNEPVEQQQLSSHYHATHESSMRRSESLPSVPESRSTAEVALSDDGSAASEESQHATTTQGSEPAFGEVANQEQVVARQGNAKSVKDATVQQPQLAIDTDGAEQSAAASRQREETSLVSTMPVISRSVSERAPPTSGLPPVPAMPKAFSELKKPAHAQPLGSLAAPNRVKAPLPAFPGRGLSVGLAGGSFGNGPMPGMPSLPSRRLTTPGFPIAPGLNAQSPLGKPRTSTPLVRSPLSSHETTPPESEQGSAQGDARPAYNRPQGHSRSQSLKTVNTTASAAGAGKPRKVFAHAGRANADKEADIVVQEVGDDKKTDKKKKGMKGLFGRKKQSA